MEPQNFIHIPFTVTTYRAHVTVMVVFGNLYRLDVITNVSHVVEVV